MTNDFAALRQQLSERLPAPHRLLIEPERIAQAAVALILRESVKDSEILIIKRAEHPHDHWSGHLALPGGRAEAADADLLATAARETREEVGINLLDGGGFIGQLPVIAPNNPRLPRLEITPLVALAPPEFTLQLSAEVAAAFWVSIKELQTRGRADRFRLKLDELEHSWPAYPTERGPIWGITERILTNFLRLL
jgi:8-oxo-dGTP pyrophosphatase MutT (NUDIX family)